jgi:hypothetical protein
MRRGLWLVSLMLPLAGCYVAPSDPEYGYAQPGYPSPPSGYPPPGYPPPAYPPGAYAPAPYDPNAGTYAPGYGYNGGAPVIVEGGMAMPLVLFGGEWGYYDRDHHWHRAPEGVSRGFEAHRGDGGQFRPNAGPHAESYPQPRSGQPGSQAAYRPTGQPQPSAPPPGAPRQAQTGGPQAAEHEHGRNCQAGQRC